MADLAPNGSGAAPPTRAPASRRGSSLAYGGVGRQHLVLPAESNRPRSGGRDAAWCRNPIDNFVLAKLGGKRDEAQSAGGQARRYPSRHLRPDRPAARPEEVEAFWRTTPDAYPKVVDRLLASPHYGERWARYWLDVARYADTRAIRRGDDPRYPDAWTYRDYVIDAFNDDKPYNQFILEQLAADRLVLAAPSQAGDDRRGSSQARLAALGFLTLGTAVRGQRQRHRQRPHRRHHQGVSRPDRHLRPVP